MYIFICIYVFQKYQYIEYICIFFFDDILSVGFAQSASCRIEMNSPASCPTKGRNGDRFVL